VSAPFHEEEALGRPYDAALMRRLLRYLRPYLLLVIAAVLMLLGVAVLQLASPYLTKVAIDAAIPARDLGLVRVLALAYLAANAAEFALEYGQTVLTSLIGQRVMVDLRMEIFAKLQRIGVAFYDRNPVGRLMTRVTTDVESLNELFTSGVVALFGDVFTLGIIAAWMLAADWRLALVSFAVVPLIYIAANAFRVRVRQAYRDIRVRIARINSYLQEHLSGMRVVQLFGAEARAAAAFGDVNRAHLDAHLKSITVYAVFFPVVELLTSFAIASVLVYGGARALDHTVTVGVLAAFLQLLRRFFRPLQDLSEKFNVLQSAMASSERVFALLDEPETVRDPAAPRALPRPVRGEVAFEDVWFRYPHAARGGERPVEAGAGRPAPEAEDDGWVLRGVSFTARPGRTLAIVGHTGAGKTTIISLLLRYYDVDRGRITVDGVDIRELAQAELRGLIGLVQQEIFLFTGDLRSNIALDAAVSDAAVEEAARRVGAMRVVERLPAGFAHRLGERGQNLSVGERQLFAFARALAVEPAILVLDEATSSVDAQAEEEIQVATAVAMRGRTSLVVAHRLSTVQHAEEILVLHHGRVLERGNHRDLLAQGGLYGRLYHLQLGADLAATG
jgi:ATP-binding cassette, subfamily B, multidrug efflux pump